MAGGTFELALACTFKLDVVLAGHLQHSVPNPRLHSHGTICAERVSSKSQRYALAPGEKVESKD